MSAIAINLAEKPILNHLSMGGDIVDAVGQALVAKFATKALNDASISAMAARYRISHDDICIIYASMIRSLMPNPCIESGGLLLVPTLFFMEPFRFTALASAIAARTQGLDDRSRIEKMIELSVAHAQHTWDAHTEGRGEAKFEIRNLGGLKSTGCLGVIVISVTLASLASYGLCKMLG